ncbi:MAG: DUF4097 domain-containing protein [Ruminococcaceae bacterium]|nr:DUF4097 domain-containing protein [Oscillospiraceae bacterium]
MRMGTESRLLVALFLILVGLILFGVIMTALKWDFTKLSTAKYETNRHEISEDFQTISITSKTANVVLLPAEDSNCTVICREQEKQLHAVEVRNGALVIEVVDTRKWYDYISLFSFESPAITVYLPQEAYDALTVKTNTGNVEVPSAFRFEAIEITASTGNIKNEASVAGELKIQTTTGNITVSGVQADSIKLSASTGKITVSDTACAGDVSLRVSTGNTKLSQLTCGSLSSIGSTGDLKLQNTVVSRLLLVERDTGNVQFDKCDAAEIRVTTDTGNVTGTLLTEKLFDAKSDTGKVEVPSPAGTEPCRIRSDTGNIRITVEDAERS